MQYAVSPKKSSLKSLISALTLYSNCEEQIITISKELAKFSHSPSEPFSEAVSKFDSLYSFSQQLKNPIKKDKLSILSKETI